MRSRCSARATSSRWTTSVSRSSSAASSRVRARTPCSSAAVAVRAACSCSRSCAAAASERGHLLQRELRPEHDLLGDGGAPVAGGAHGDEALAGGPLLPGGPLQRVGPAGQPAGPLLPRAHGQPHLHLAGAGRARLDGQPVADLACSAPRSSGAASRGREPLLELGEPRQVAVAGLLGAHAGPAPAGPASASAARAALASRPSCSARAAIRASLSCSCCQRGGHLGAGALDPLAGRRHRGDEPLVALLGLVVARGGLVDRGLHLEQRRRAGRAADRPVGAEQVAVGGHRAQARLGELLAPARGRRRRRRRRAPGTARPAARAGAWTRSSAQRAPAGSGRPVRPASAGAPPPTSRPARPASSALSRASASAASAGPATATASASAPSAAATAVSAPGLDLHERGHAAEHARQVGGQQRARAVLAAQRQGQRVAAGRPGGPLALGLALLRRERGQLLGGGVGLGLRGLVPLVEADLALVEAARLLLQRGQLGAGPGRALVRLLERAGQPARARPTRRPRGCAARPTWPCSRASPSRRSATARTAATSAFSSVGERRLEVGAPGHRVAQPLGVGGQRPGELGLLLAHGRRLAVERLRVAARARLLGQRRGEVPPALGGQPRGAAQPLLERRQQVPGLLRPGQPRRLVGRGLLERGLARPAPPPAPSRPRPAARAARSRRAPRPRAPPAAAPGRRRAAAAGRRAGRPAPAAARRATSACRPSGLSWRRSSTVRSVRRVRLACIASSLRRAFSLRFLCLRTPAASSMNARRSSGRADSTASSWPCPTTTCSSRPMPLSLISSCTSTSRQRSPLMEYSDSPDRNISRRTETSAYSIGSAPSLLSIVSVTSARPSGGRPGRAGEDDVLHLAAAQRLGALLAEHPGHRVDDVALARAVRADDAGDAGLEAQRRRRTRRT